MVKTAAKPVYKYDDPSYHARDHQDFIRLGGEVWQIYRYYSSKAAATKAAESLRTTLRTRVSASGAARIRVVKTVKGWGVFQQSANKEYHVSPRSPFLKKREV